MAGMFYSMQEVTEKLGKTEDEIKELVKQGRLREFRDGPNLLFKIDEVEALLSDTTFIGAKPAGEVAEPAAAGEEISVLPEEAEEIGELASAEPEPADGDTALAAEGINVLGETDTEYKLSDDTMAETKSGSAEGAALEAIEEDVSLDTFGSGSGLLDLSLQADDTSLGGILDEIYTSEGEDAEQAAASGSTMGVAAEAEQMVSEEEPAAAAAPAEAVIMAGYVEPEPDASSKVLGFLLLLPLALTLYTTIVAVSGQRGTIPSVLRGVQGMIWYVMGGAFVVALVIAVIGFASVPGGRATARKPKAKKEKKPKKAKEKKVKKPKKKKGSDAESQA